MKNIKGLLTLFLCLTALSLSAQKNKNKRGAHYTYEVSCLGSEMDGTITLESYGSGRNYNDASEQAKKNAVSAVIFKGIKIGAGDCNKNPLIFSANAERRYEEYFANFFKDNGPYLEFVSLKDERRANKMNRNAKKSKQIQQRMVVVRIDRLALKKKLEADNIK
jgi:hypothetical protein